MDACLKASLELYGEVSAANPDFKKAWDSTLAFRNDQYLWWQVAEYYLRHLPDPHPHAGVSAALGVVPAPGA